MRVSGESRPQRPRWQTWLAIAFTAGALLWMGDLVRQAWPTLVETCTRLSLPWMVVAMIACLAGTALQGENFHLLVRDLGGASLSRSRTYALQFIAHLVRHMPGRFWGIAYQIARTRGEISASALLIVHTVLAAAAAYFTGWCALTILAFGKSVSLGLVAAVGGALLLLLSVPLARAAARIGDRLPTLPGRFGRVQLQLVDAIARMPVGAALHFHLIVLVGWLLYLGAWALFGEAYPGLDAGQGLRIVAYYSLAWIVGFLAVFTPSGLGVREVVFLGLASEFPADVLATTAILGRVWLLLNDLLLGALALMMRLHDGD